MNRPQLKQLINEELNRYMFFQNLKSIKMMVDEMLELDEQMIDNVLVNGHDWADDHIATSKDDIEEVHNFLMTKKAPVKLSEEVVEVDVPENIHADLIKNGFKSLNDLFTQPMRQNKDKLSYETKEWIQTVLKPKYIYPKK